MKMKWTLKSWTVIANFIVLLYALFYPGLSDEFRNGLIALSLTNLALRIKTQGKIK